jgi:integrase
VLIETFLTNVFHACHGRFILIGAYYTPPRHAPGLNFYSPDHVFREPMVATNLPIRWHRPLGAEESVQRPKDRIRPISPATANRHVALLRRAYGLGREKLGLVHPTLTFPMTKERKNPRPIPEEVLADIFGAMEALHESEARRRVLRFLYLAGPRKGQVLATRVEQFSSATGMVTWEPEDTKSETPHRVTYTGEALDILRWFADRHDPRHAALFQDVDGKPITKNRLDATWHRACRRAGLPIGRQRGGYVIHHLRHSFVSEAHDAGLAAGVIMAHTGHVQEPTMLHYLRVSGAAQQRAQEQLEAHRKAQTEKVRTERERVVRLADRRVG